MNLIVQGDDVPTPDLKELHRISRGAAIERITDGAFRITRADPAMKPQVAEHAARSKLDFGFVEEGRALRDFGLLAMDMDSTLITIECIDELGDLAGKKAEVAGITARAMRGEIDYPQSLRERVSLLAGLPVSALERVYQERLRLTPGAQALIAACKKHGVKILLVSGGFTFFVERLKERLALDYTISNVLEIERNKLTGKVTGDIVGAEAKAETFLQVSKTLKAEKHQTVAIGDGANDLKMMKEAGTSIAFHAKPVVRAQADYSLSWSGLDGVLNLLA